MNWFEAIRIRAEKLHAELVQARADSADPRRASWTTPYADTISNSRFWLPTIRFSKAPTRSSTGKVALSAAPIPGQQASRPCSSLTSWATVWFMPIPAAAPTSMSTRPAPQKPLPSACREWKIWARERRELEANVFARELLFPRSAARRMHVDEMRTASGIAAALNLPLPLVRQQILDALLLPPLPRTAPSSNKPAIFSPDLAQDKAAFHRGTPFQLRAGPGTGKTRTLVERIRSLLADNVQPGAILVLTFSNKTAAELSERLDKVLPNPVRPYGSGHSMASVSISSAVTMIGLASRPIRCCSTVATQFRSLR